MEKVTKIQAAERQLNASIRMFFGGEDPIATHNVACAAFDLLRNLAEKTDRPSLMDKMLGMVNESKKNDMIELWRKPQNFLKHANRDPDDVLEYNPEILKFYLAFASIAYSEFTNKDTPEVRGFILWFSLMHPDLIKFPDIDGQVQAHVEKWGRPSADKDKRMMLELIDDYKKKVGLEKTEGV